MVSEGAPESPQGRPKDPQGPPKGPKAPKGGRPAKRPAQPGRSVAPGGLEARYGKAVRVYASAPASNGVVPRHEYVAAARLAPRASSGSSKGSAAAACRMPRSSKPSQAERKRA